MPRLTLCPLATSPSELPKGTALHAATGSLHIACQDAVVVDVRGPPGRRPAQPRGEDEVRASTLACLMVFARRPIEEHWLQR